VRDQDKAQPVDFTLDLVWLYHMATHDTGAAGASMSLVNAIENGQTAVREPDAYLLPQLLL
jgi:hypothetical protein